MVIDEIFRNLRWKEVVRVINKTAPNPVVCDIGCGSGKFLNKISGLIEKGFGFDKNLSFSDNPKVFLGQLDLDVEKIPLKDDSVDIVTMIAVLEHLNYPDLILGEISRILKKNGFLIITTPSPMAKPVLSLLVLLKLINKGDIDEHKKYYSAADIKKLLLRSGFSEKKVNIKRFEFGFNILAVVRG